MKRENVVTVLQSVNISVGVASDSLENNEFDLWTRLYGFVAAGLQKAM